MDVGQIVNYLQSIRVRLASKCSALLAREAPRAKNGRTSSRSPSSNRTPSRSFPAVFFAGMAIFVGVSIFHIWHLSSLFENDRFFSHLSQMEREMTFRTEQGLYYSFYKRIVEAPSFFRGLMDIMHDRTTEYPDQVNFLNRFNLYPEVFLAAVFRIYTATTRFFAIPTTQCFLVHRGAPHPPITACVGLGDPFYLYLAGVFSLNGLLVGVLFLTGWLLSESLLGGVITVAAFLANHGEATRVMWTPPLRESFGYPFFVMEMLAVSYVLKTRCRTWQMSGLVGVLATLFILQWQFAQFVLLTQTLALLLLFLTGFLETSVLCTIIRGLFYSLLVSYILLCFNSFLLTSAYGVIVISLFLVMEWHRHRKTVLPELFGRFSRRKQVLLVGCVGVVPVVKAVVGGKDDEHVWQILRSKFTGFRNFHTMLYTCAPEFDFIGVDVLGKLCRALLLPISVCIVVIVADTVVRTLVKGGPPLTDRVDSRPVTPAECPAPQHSLYDPPYSKRRNGRMSYRIAQRCKGDSPVRTGQTISLDIVYHVLQAGAFTVLALLIMRLKLLWTPQLCILASLLASRSVFGFVRRSWHIGFVVGLLGCMLPVGVHNLRVQHNIMGEYSNYPLEGMLTWVNSNTPTDAVFAGPMATMANLHLTTGRPIVNHPHYENAEMRERTLRVYSMYSRQSPKQVHRIHQNLSVDYVVFEKSYCWRRHKAGCAMPEMWDVEQPERARSEACCYRILENPHPFRWAYWNDVYGVLQV